MAWETAAVASGPSAYIADATTRGAPARPFSAHAWFSWGVKSWRSYTVAVPASHPRATGCDTAQGGVGGSAEQQGWSAGCDRPQPYSGGRPG